jgi:hypothetical protein
VREAYFQAAQTSPDMVDADVQVGLGVLFNINHEYDKAVTCFETALSARSVTSRLVGCHPNPTHTCRYMVLSFS